MNLIYKLLGHPVGLHFRLSMTLLGAQAIILVIVLWGHNWNNALHHNAMSNKTIVELQKALLLSFDTAHRLSDHILSSNEPEYHINKTSNTTPNFKSQGDNFRCESCGFGTREIHDTFENFTDDLNKWRAMQSSPTPKIDEYVEAMDQELHKLLALSLPLLEKLTTTPGIRLEPQERAAFQLSFHKLHHKIKEVFFALTQRSFESFEYTFTTTEKAKLQLWILWALFLPLSVLMIPLFVRWVRKPVKRLQDNLSSLVSGTGNLTDRLEPDAGDTGVLTQQYNALLDKLQVAMTQIAIVTMEVKSGSEHLNNDALQTLGALSGQEAEVDEVVVRMASMEQEINAIRTNTSAATQAAESALETTNRAQQVMQQSHESMQRLDEESAKNLTQVESFVANAESIDSIGDVIRGVADQTNLLALNAAIEAARAGEQGRGFAVVADEVRNLASRTQQLTTEITKQVQGLKQNAEQTRTSMAQNRDSVARTLNEVEALVTPLQEVGQATQSIAGLNQEIDAALLRQSEELININRNAVNLKATTSQAELNSQEMQAVSTLLANQVNELIELLKGFNLQVDFDKMPAINRPAISTSSSDGGQGGDDDEITFF